ncbi:hypothetical protein P43SY_001638 [Pythium insidiosum]|uniref:PH domain-containing protein n=1 Tax=Pythium insidiosum TaxID=114742 RepID=A0AAD5M6E1_PYTIN|nr:hypothetical protein P43SY_001638 [Pythium insidiosum]
MAPIGSSLRNMMRGNSTQSMGSGEPRSNNSSETSALSDDSDIQMQGWMRKQKETLRVWARRYFALSGKLLTYYDSEDISRAPRGVLEVVDVAPLTTEHNGLALHLTNGKEVRLIADTHVAYTAWLSVLSAAVKNPQATKSRMCKDGWAHCLTDDDVWTRYFIVVKNDSFSCYESEDEDAELALSGLVRSVGEWDGKRFGLVLGLNRSRKIQLCFDSAEEKMTWFLTLEFAVSYSHQRLKKEVSMKGPDSNPANRSAASSSAEKAPAAADSNDDDGVWI